MRSSILLLALVTATTAFDFPESWEAWKREYGKTYPDEITELRRHATWQSNKKYVDEHNEYLADRLGFTLGMNEYADLDSAEFVQLYTGYLPPPPPSNSSGTPPPPDSEIYIEKNVDIPPFVDWRLKGYVTHVKNQGQCGSCYSFSANGALEGQHFKATGRLVSLSEQNIVDCSGRFGNQGCHGGWMHNVYNYIRANGGVDTESSYPYEARVGSCRYNPANKGAMCRGYSRIPIGNEQALTNAIANVGPIAVAVHVTQAFQLYRGGVFYDPDCNPRMLNHAVLAVGYGTASGREYYIVKNSWGSGWGVGGYIYMSRNRNNNCGIATVAEFPIV